MNPGDLFQTISLIAVAVTIGLSARQNRHVAVQTRETVQQSTLAQSELKQASHQNMVAYSSSYLAMLTTSDSDLLSWFLASRGVPPASDEVNQRYMLMYLRMEVHETTYLAYLEGTLPEDVWDGWQRVIELDAATPEFLTVWRVVSDSYAKRFGTYINSVISNSVIKRGPHPIDAGGNGGSGTPDGRGEPAIRRSGRPPGRSRSTDPTARH